MTTNRNSTIKRILYLAPIISLALLFSSVNAQAILIDGINYSLNSDGTASVIQGSTQTSGDLLIPPVVLHWTSSAAYDVYYVTSISPYAFSNYKSLTSITISYTVTSIGNNAFSGCSSVMTVTIYGNSITTINPYTFAGCSSLNYFTIPGTVKTIGSHAFYGCRGLQSIVIPNSVTCIGNLAFGDCDQLYLLSIPKSVRYIDGCITSGCNELSLIRVASDNAYYDSRNNCNAIIKTAENKLISGCKLSTIPNTVTSIGDYAFANCSYLMDVTIPSSVTSIGNQAFSGCSNLNDIYSAPDPYNVILGNNVFYKVPVSTCILHIDPDYENDYRTADQWRDFINIETDFSGIEYVSADNANNNIIGYYDLNGIFHYQPIKGINIVKYSNGKTEKIIIN